MRAEKQSIVSELSRKVGDSIFVIVTDYRGMTVAKAEDLRRRLRGVRAQFQVVQNRLFARAAQSASLKGMESALKGPSAMVYGAGDVVQVAKVLRDFIRENELPVIKMGSLEGLALSAGDIEQLAGLPSREVLLGRFVGTVAAPLSRLVGVLQQKVASLLYVLRAIQEKKEKGQ
jgi:large subunit ribosomal protein L10